MPYIRLKENGEREYLDTAPKYFFDGGIPVTDEWLITNENIYPVVDQDISEETDVIDIVTKNINDWIVDTNNVIRTVRIVKDEDPGVYEESYQYTQLQNEELWKIETDYIYRTYDIITKSLDEAKSDLKITLKNNRYIIETGGFYFYYDSTSQGDHYNIETNRENQIQILSYSIIGESFEEINWKSYDQFITLTPDNITSLHISLQTFVKMCFDNELRIATLIDEAVDYDELKNIYDVEFIEGWPNESIYLDTGE